jgi:hypothetical protein
MTKWLAAVLVVSLAMNALLGWQALRGWRDRDHLISEIRRRERTMGDVVRIAKEIWPVRGLDAIERTLRERVSPSVSVTRIQGGTVQDVTFWAGDVRLHFYRDSLVAMWTMGQPWEYLR